MLNKNKHCKHFFNLNAMYSFSLGSLSFLELCFQYFSLHLRLFFSSEIINIPNIVLFSIIGLLWTVLVGQKNWHVR